MRMRVPVETGEEQTLGPILLGKVSRTELTRCDAEALAQHRDAFVSGTLQTTGTADGTSCISARPSGCEGWFSAAPLLVTAGDRPKNSDPRTCVMDRWRPRTPQLFSATARAE
jgi:hypothetical protein